MVVQNLVATYVPQMHGNPYSTEQIQSLVMQNLVATSRVWQPVTTEQVQSVVMQNLVTTTLGAWQPVTAEQVQSVAMQTPCYYLRCMATRNC